jgi:hypothetical protein
MKFSKIVFAVFSALIVLSSAFEGGEEACPDYQDSPPDCEKCVSADCGYVIDEGDCVKDCLTVTDSECFSVNATGGEVEDICAKAEDANKKETSSPSGGKETSPPGNGKTPTAAPAPTSSAASFMTSLVEWTVLVAGVGFVVW